MKSRHLKKALKKEAAIAAGQKSAKMTWREKQELARIREIEAAKEKTDGRTE
jgi:hypothetical protein